MEIKKVLIWALVIVIGIALIFALFFRDKINPVVKVDISDSDDSSVLEDFKKDLDKLAKGGYTIEQSKTMQADAECPTQNDQYFAPMWCTEYENVVVFSYRLSTDNGLVYPNIAFKRVGQKLSLDGIMNATLVCKRQYGIGMIGAGGYKWNKAYVKLDFSSPTPAYNYTRSSTGHTRRDNYLSITSNDLYYWDGYNHDRNSVSPSKKEIQRAREFASKALLDTVQNYFLNFGNLRLQTQTAKGADVYAYINSYFAYIYSSCKDAKSNSATVVNANEFLTYDIPADEQKNYPIPESKKADYPSDWTYYKMYKCDKYVRVTYVNYKAYEVKTKNPSEDYIDKIDCEVVPAQTKQYVHQFVKLRNYNGADLSYYDAVQNPVQIDFISNDEETKTVILNDKNRFSAGVDVVLALGKTYNYKITSSVLCFDNLEGSFVSKDNSTLILNFAYYNNAVMCTFGLNPIGSIDFTQINLAEHPVTVTFSTGQTIVWDSNDSFNTRQSVLLTLGEVEYTILSDALTFATTAGKITVDTTNRTILFNCASSVQSDIVLRVGTEDESCSIDRTNIILLYASADEFSEFTNAGYNLSAYLYDGETQYALTSCQPPSGGSSLVNTAKICFELPSNFDTTAYGADYHIYKLQLKLSNGSKVYLSNLVDFKQYYCDENHNVRRTDVSEIQFNITL